MGWHTLKEFMRHPVTAARLPSSLAYFLRSPIATELQRRNLVPQLLRQKQHDSLEPHVHEQRDCVVKLRDDHEVEHSIRLHATVGTYQRKRESYWPCSFLVLR